MHLAPMRRPPLRPSPAAFRSLPLVALLLLVGGCALPDPGPSPMVCPSTPGGCAEEDAPWYRQDVTAMIPPPPVEPLPTPDPATTAEPAGKETAIGDPLADPYAAGPVTEPVVSSFASPERTTDTVDTRSSAGTAPTEATPPRTPAAVARNEPSGAADTPSAASPSDTVVRLASDRLFELGGATLQPTGRRALDALADRLHGTPYTRIRVVGHTDRSGKAATNLNLSRQRARIVRDHLVTRGIPSEALDHEGRGSRDAVVDPERCGRRKDVRIRCLAPDRRIDIVITRRRAP